MPISAQRCSSLEIGRLPQAKTTVVGWASHLTAHFHHNIFVSGLPKTAVLRPVAASPLAAGPALARLATGRMRHEGKSSVGSCRCGCCWGRLCWHVFALSPAPNGPVGGGC